MIYCAKAKSIISMVSVFYSLLKQLNKLITYSWGTTPLFIKLLASDNIVDLSGTCNFSCWHALIILLSVSSPYLTLMKDFPSEFNLIKSDGFSSVNSNVCCSSLNSIKDSLPPMLTKIGINHLTSVVSFSPFSNYHSCFRTSVHLLPLKLSEMTETKGYPILLIHPSSLVFRLLPKIASHSSNKSNLEAFEYFYFWK